MRESIKPTQALKSYESGADILIKNLRFEKECTKAEAEKLIPFELWNNLGALRHKLKLFDQSEIAYHNSLNSIEFQLSSDPSTSNSTSSSDPSNPDTHLNGSDSHSDSSGILFPPPSFLPLPLFPPFPFSFPLFSSIPSPSLPSSPPPSPLSASISLPILDSHPLYSTLNGSCSENLCSSSSIPSPFTPSPFFFLPPSPLSPVSSFPSPFPLPPSPRSF